MNKEENLNAIVLNSFDFKEKDKVLEIFTLEKGRIKVLLKGARGNNAKLKAGGQIFAFGEFSLINTSGFSRVKSIDIQENFFNISNNLLNYYSALALIEIIKNALDEGQKNELVFINMLRSLDIISNKNVDNKIVLSKFINGILKISGYRLNYTNCSECNTVLANTAFFTTSESKFKCKNCKTNYDFSLNSNNIKALKYLDKTETKDLDDENIIGENKDKIFNLMVNRLEFNFGRKMKTISMMKKGV